MPWRVEKTDSCPASKPWGVINEQSGEVEGCHETEQAAQEQMAALYANEGESKDSVTQRRSQAKSIHIRRLESMRERVAARLIAYARDNGTSVADLSSVELPWYAIRTLDDSVPTVFIYDEIGGSFGVSAKKFAQDLQAIDSDRIRVRINSPGGSVFDALAIHSALLHHRAHKTVFVDGVAASAASVIAMAGDEIVMMPGAQLMIHDASMMEDGNARDHEMASTFLDRQSQNLADIYALRGGTADEWRERMLAETWMFPREAVQCGLADKLADVRPSISDPDLEQRMTRRHSLTQFRYEGRANAPAPQQTRAGGARTSPRVQREERRDMSPIDKRTAAQRRAEALSGKDGYVSRSGGYPGMVTRSAERMPGSVARMVPFPTRELGVRNVLKNGTSYVEFTGQASVFDMPYAMWDEYGPYDEIVDSGAEKRTLSLDPDVAFLENHRGLTMARTRNGTLQLSSSDGLDVLALANPKRDDVDRLRMAIEDRDVTEMSFAFMIDEGWWSEDFTEFHIAQFDIDRGDVSAVNYGANPFTSISARQRSMFADIDHMPMHLARAAMLRLQKRVGTSNVDSIAVPPVNTRTAGESTVEIRASEPRQQERGRVSLKSVNALLDIWSEEERNRAVSEMD